jgi:hypothetical protein
LAVKNTPKLFIVLENDIEDEGESRRKGRNKGYVYLAAKNTPKLFMVLENDIEDEGCS